VVVEVTIDEEGNVISARAISGHPLLKDAAIDAARGWTFNQTLLQGVPVKVIGTITFRFELGDSFEPHDPKELEALKRQVHESPNSPEAHLKLADAYVYRGNNDEAIDEYSEAIRLSPNFATAYYQLGRLYQQLQRYDEALDAYRFAINIPPELASVNKPSFTLADQTYMLIASIHLDRAQYAEALNVLSEAAKLYPDLMTLHLYLARAYLGLGDKHSALGEYELVKKSDPEFAREILKEIRKKP
ncbi:MAG TPA: tetratricopeptide repeat protein, partial [Blastocatellia bacterium]|nr:tetratricopeptide repeat protein [Blastocatellia bacterium]